MPPMPPPSGRPTPPTREPRRSSTLPLPSRPCHRIVSPCSLSLKPGDVHVPWHQPPIMPRRLGLERRARRNAAKDTET